MRAQCEAALLAASRYLRASKTFGDLLTRVNEEIGRIRGVGDLMVYDTSVRRSAYLRLRLKCVSLHAGVEWGATRLGLPTKAGCLRVNEVPPASRCLSAGEAEDVLCIYQALARISSGVE